MIYIILIIAILNLLGCLNAHFNQSDRLTDIIYAFSFVIITAGLLSISHIITWSQVLLFLMISIWAIRLAVYLGYRVKVWGHDHRFDDIRSNLKSLVGFWTLQYLSILILALPIFVTFHKLPNVLLTLQWIALAIFTVGLFIETIADIQKFKFKQLHKQELVFINTGLWRKTRHPNYLGEFLVWVAIFTFCSPFLVGIEWLAVASPLWIYILLRYISGGNILEKSADTKYGHLIEYREYKNKTGILFPKLF